MKGRSNNVADFSRKIKQAMMKNIAVYHPLTEIMVYQTKRCQLVRYAEGTIISIKHF
jgi:hypothetical protein